MARLILFSGGCNSGKTTTLKAVASKLQNLGLKVNILDELIRKETDKPIDDLRKNPKQYLLLQDKIIRAKIEQEKAAIEDIHSNIYLADRAVTDSMFYLENYVDKSQLDEESLSLFYDLHDYVHNYLLQCFRLYFLVVEFKPIDVHEIDLFRPTQINMAKEYEAICISRLNFFYSYGKFNLMRVNLNKISLREVVDKIFNKIDL